GAEGAEGAEGAGGAGVARGASGPGGPGAATAAAATAGGFYFTDRYASDLIVRQKTASDSPLPSGNAVAAIALLELGQPEPARRVLQAFASQLDRGAEGMSSMVEAALLYVRAHGPVDPTPAAAGHGGFAGTGAPVADASAAGGASANDSDASAAGATRDVASPDQVAAGVVAVRAAWAAPQQLNVHVDVLDAFHINAHQASHGLVPTALRLTGVEPADIAGIDYPPGEERRFAFAEEPIRIYHGAITIAVRFARATSDRPLSLRLTYQACDENACLPPITKQVEVPPA
ncbi:MAG TPA: protein-disulfide reductase DsbD domain-containing protein, partial [Tepidisphaeraceae bacterium]|nr:protein-disulfide reductase DsbD domain-containing protein [Tepidisphaeraceae bacterium]